MRRVRIPLEGDEILRVHEERTLGAAKALMNARVDEPRISDIPMARDITDVFQKTCWGATHRDDKFVIIFIGDILAYSKLKEEHEVHLKSVLETLRKRSLHKVSKLNSSVDMNTSMNVNSSIAVNDSVNYVEMCNKCLELEAELIKQHNMVEKDDLKADLQAKDTTIEKLKANIKRLNKLPPKTTYKQLYDSIKPSRVRAKEHTESLVNQLNQKKDIDDNADQVSNATTIALGMYKLNPVTLAPKVKNNREAHIYYLKHTMEQAAILS
ncbi:hypothetical protein Tco_1283583 [Tanacetum coccineum]